MRTENSTVVSTHLFYNVLQNMGLSLDEISSLPISDVAKHGITYAGLIAFDLGKKAAENVDFSEDSVASDLDSVKNDAFDIGEQAVLLLQAKARQQRKVTI